MKTIRLGNDVQINWYITRFGSPEDFTGKNLTVKLIDKLGTEQVFGYEIEGNRITGIFFGKDQSTNGVYRLLLVENDGEEDMVSLDYIDAFCLSNKMKNQTSNGSDTTSTINTEVEEYESQIDLEQDLFLYAKKTYVNEKIDEVNHRIDNLPILNAYTKEEADARFTTKEEIDKDFYNKQEINDAFYNKQEIDKNIYTKDQVDQIIEKLPASDTYTKSEIDAKIEDVSSGIPTKTSDLTNDSGYATEEWVKNKHYLVASDIAGKADASNVYTKAQVDTKLEGKADKSDIPTKTSDLTNDSGFVSANNLADVATSGSYNDLSDKPTIPSLDGYATEEWVENKHYLVSSDIEGKADASTVYNKTQVDNKLALKADKSDIPTKTSELTNDSGFVSGNELSDVAKSGSYNDLTDKPTIPSLDGYATEAWVEGKHYLVSADIAGKADSSTVYTKVQVDTKLEGKADVGDIPTKTSDLTNDSGFIDTTALATLFDGAEYDSTTKRINFKHGSNILAYVDATAFIKDGMVESVVIENGYVVITFNTDAGKEAIKIDITDIFNPANYYDKTAVNGLLEGKQNVILDLNQIRLDASAGAIAYGWGNHANAGYAKDADLSGVAKSGSYNDLTDKPIIPSLDGYATEQWVEGKHYLVANDVSTFVDSSTVYTKLQVDNKLALKADKSEIPTKTSELTNDSGFVSGNDLSNVATSGSYNDLIDKPTIPAAPVQSDWNENDTNNLAYINNKPTIPSKTSDLTNDSDFITQAVAEQNFEAKAWRGTQAEYDALTVIEQNKIYIILPAS